MMHYALTMPLKSGRNIDGSSQSGHTEHRHLLLRDGRLRPCDDPQTDTTFVLKSLGVVLSVPETLVGTYKALDDAIMALQSELKFGGLADEAKRDDGAACTAVPAFLNGGHQPAGSILLHELPHRFRTDTVVEHLINALSTIELDDSESSLIYADAVRLALVTRLVGGLNEDRSPSKTPLPKWRLRKAVDYIDTHLSRTITLKDLAAAAGLSRMHFAAQFRAATGLRPREFVLHRRIKLAQQLMVETPNSLVDIALTVGFQTQAHFTTVFKRFVGDTPHRWRCAQPHGELREQRPTEPFYQATDGHFCERDVVRRRYP